MRKSELTTTLTINHFTKISKTRTILSRCLLSGVASAVLKSCIAFLTQVLAAGVDTGAMSSKDDLENIFGSSNSHNSSNNLGKSKHFTHVQKARDRVRISRGRVEMYEQELESTIPDSDLFHSKRRGTLASVLFHNFCICDLKVASNASDAHLGDIHEIVNVVGDQAEELLLLIEQLINAPRTTDTNGTMIKAYANALRTAISDLFLLDGTELGWSSVRKAVQQIASIAQKADAAVIFLEHHSDTSDDAFGIPPVLPVSLKLRKPRGQQEDQQQQQKQQQRRPQRSRIEEYYFQTIPEVQRDAMEMKEMINGLAKKAKQNAKAHGLGGAQKREGVTALLNAQVLRAVTTYKAPTASGLSRMDKGVELKVQQALHDIGRMQMDNAERKRRQLYAGA